MATAPAAATVPALAVLAAAAVALVGAGLGLAGLAALVLGLALGLAGRRLHRHQGTRRGLPVLQGRVALQGGRGRRLRR